MARKNGGNRGIVEKPVGSGKWWVRLYVNGRERRFRAENKTQARAVYGRLKADIRENKYFPDQFKKPKALTVRMIVNRYLSGSTNRSLTTEKIFGKFWIALWGNRLITEITAEDCRQLQAKLKAKGEEKPPEEKPPTTKRRAKGRWKPATINRHFAFLRHVLMLAVKDGHLIRNPASDVKFFPEANRTRYFTDEELRHLHGLIDPENWKLVAFALETGLRRTEQFQLRWEHISFESRTLTIPMPKGGKTRHVPLSRGAVVLLRSFDSLNSSWVFPRLRNFSDNQRPSSPMDSRAFLRRVYEPALRKAGIQDGSWHTLRHTTASRLVMAGVPLPTVKEILGHRDIQTTLRYAHLSPGHIQSAIEKGSLAHLEFGTGTKTGTSETEEEAETMQVVDFMVRPTGVEPVTS